MVKPPAFDTNRGREHGELEAFFSSDQMIHQSQTKAECLLLAFRAASRSEFPRPEHFDDFDGQCARGFTIDSLRIGLFRARDDSKSRFVLRKLNGGGWDHMRQLPAGVYIIQCQVKMFDGHDSRFPHFVALDTHQSTISDPLRPSLVAFTDSWAHSASHDVVIIVHMFQIMCKC